MPTNLFQLVSACRIRAPFQHVRLATLPASALAYSRILVSRFTSQTPTVNPSKSVDPGRRAEGRRAPRRPAMLSAAVPGRAAGRPGHHERRVDAARDRKPRPTTGKAAARTRPWLHRDRRHRHPPPAVQRSPRSPTPRRARTAARARPASPRAPRTARPPPRPRRRVPERDRVPGRARPGPGKTTIQDRSERVRRPPSAPSPSGRLASVHRPVSPVSPGPQHPPGQHRAQRQHRRDLPRVVPGARAPSPARC